MAGMGEWPLRFAGERPRAICWENGVIRRMAPIQDVVLQV
jgi:hypothetical protein